MKNCPLQPAQKSLTTKLQSKMRTKLYQLLSMGSGSRPNHTRPRKRKLQLRRTSRKRTIENHRRESGTTKSIWMKMMASKHRRNFSELWKARELARGSFIRTLWTFSSEHSRTIAEVFSIAFSMAVAAT